MVSALEIGLEVDLLQFSQYLQGSGIPHRITQEGSKQVVWVRTSEHAAKVAELFEDYKIGILPELPIPLHSPESFKISLLSLRSPLTFMIILINLFVFVLTQYSDEDGVIFRIITFSDFRIEGKIVYFDELADTLGNGEYWRLFTPMFIHFGLIHLVFNLLWVWEVGRRIEIVSGTSVLLLIIIVSSLAANLFQYSISGPSFFGGMSGVVFGLFGYGAVWSWLVPSKTIGLVPAIYKVMLGYLLLGFTGIFSFLGLGDLANGAHLGGLIAGLLVGSVAGLLFRQNEEIL